MAVAGAYRDDGIVVIDKPENMSSARVVAKVKAALGAAKAGHTGTLDPFATGVLICCINRATRLARFFLEGDKAYEATLRLGIETDTQDATGAVISEKAVGDVSMDLVSDIVRRFVGWTDQVPPAYSALKHKGVPLYRLARKGTPVQKPARRVHISRICILEIAPPYIRFEVHCSTGTYIRTLCADMGRAIGCGAHLTALRRTLSSGFAIADALTLSGFEALAAQGNLSGRLIGMADALKGIPAMVAGDQLAGKVAQGIRLSGRDVTPDVALPNGGYIKIVDRTGQLLAVVQLKKERKSYDYCCVFQS